MKDYWIERMVETSECVARSSCPKRRAVYLRLVETYAALAESNLRSADKPVRRSFHQKDTQEVSERFAA
jgi:hypothetical protein